MFARLAVLAALAGVALSCGSQSGSCGGCRRRKVHGTTVLEVVESPSGEIYGLSVWASTQGHNESAHELTNPNTLFGKCCAERELPAACQRLCHFDAYNEGSIHSVMADRDQCPKEFLNEMHFCAAQGRDHRRCCQKTGVAKTVSGDKCLVFCDQRPDQYTQLDFSYLPCLDQVDTMKKCFYQEVKSAAENRFLADNEAL